ncbi:cation diffusion facilitator CzcD-associated flavoprotein CzcO [Deinococcus budaensis]|uniref:Cation diffusion facilitator CzcD-associated flavoprotein CzcO n=2 Tax=Deinococcus budaensis TaxID=1665626 RepID=A0A7W8GEC9_9DEIO|nr:cation diffusion facilitator CzcD-associated flavoprotein CzcO [Deinococcus budaensis]
MTGAGMTHALHHQIAIIGSGFAGLGMAAGLRRRGVTDFVVFERAGEVGGTWRDNTYPGCACDVKSDLYSFSFAPNPGWGHRYARQPEILAYLRRVADDFGIRPHIRFGHEVERAEWDEAEGVWRIQTNRGAYTARVLISGHGPLIEPKWPAVQGLETFSGPRFHSARWDHAVDLRGKRVAVVGTGASAIQFVPEVQKVAGQLTVFQRSAPWVLPRMDEATSGRRRALYRRLPALQRLSRQWIFGVAEARFLSFSSARVGRLAEETARKHLEAQVADPALRAKLTPDYRLGCKRILLSDDYYPALTQPNVELVTDPIREVRGNRVVTADGQEREFDVLIGGTGFNATQPAIAGVIHGRGGRSLAQVWQPHMEALHGTAVAGFPNLFLIIGPNTGLGHNSMVYMMEAQIGYILGALDYLEKSELLALEPRPEAQAAYNAALQDKLRGTVWMQGGCTSWYIDDQGRNTSLWPERAAQFRRTLSRFDPSLYQVRLSPRPLPALLSAARSA